MTGVRTFTLVRDRDVSGVSGTGLVAHGVLFPDGNVATRWNAAIAQTCVWRSLDDVRAIHGHGGATRIVWDNDGARDGADVLDELERIHADLKEVRRLLGEKSVDYDVATAWLELIAEQGCVNFTNGIGSCTSDPARWAVARYSADRWCDPCRAWAAENGVPMSTQPSEAEEADV